MRSPLLLLAVALAAALAFAAWLDPALPFLRPAPDRTWWAHPEPLSRHGATGPHTLAFRFTPSRAGELELTAMSRFRVREGERLLAEGPPAGASWKAATTLVVATLPLVVEAEDARWLPVLGLGGPAAPAAVEVVRAGQPVAARPAREALGFRSALSWPLTGLALALLATLGAATALLALRSPRRPRRAPTPAKLAIGTIVAAHALLALWNVWHYPLARGLDADGHLEYCRLILERQELPPPSAGWQTYHPPLYHAAGALALGLSGSERSLQALSALAGLALVGLVAYALGAARWRGLLLVAALPVLLVTEPQATNEVWLAALATATLIAAGSDHRQAPILTGLLAGLALLTRYTGLFFLVAAVVAPWLGPRRPGRTRAAALTLAVALMVGSAPYIERARLHGDPFVGNWDDGLGHPYRQPPGYRHPSWFLRFGASFLAHPFEARRASFWDSLWVSTFEDGFGRFMTSPLQHRAGFVLAWLALPLAITVGLGMLSLVPRSRRDDAGLVAALLALAALVRFNLELPYWSTAKGVFLLGLALPAATMLERGRDELEARAGPLPARALDLVLLAFAALSALSFAYRI